MTPAIAPSNYAQTQHSLGLVHVANEHLPQAIVCGREAEKYYRLMGYTDNADEMLRWIEEAEEDISATDAGEAD